MIFKSMDSEEDDICIDQIEPLTDAGEPVDNGADTFSEQEDVQTVRTIRNFVVTFRRILSFDWITNEFFQRQVALGILFVILTIVYITNRYMSQRELVHIQELKVEKQEKMYIWLNTQSDVSASTRPSTIEKMIKEAGFDLNTTSTAPYMLPFNREE